jgi:2-succinyl-5-enolpyruvyl-6-hydroxy-3-cyclohexene-1-carboxylate synthase
MWLKGSSIRDHVLIDDHAGLDDPFECATWTITSPLTAVGEEIGKRLKRDNSAPSAYSASWRTADGEAMHLLQSRRPETTEIFAGDVVAAVFEHAFANQVVYLSSSMAIRFAEMYAQARNTPLRILFNRGANGIDGVVSSAVGAAAGLDARIVLVTGDIALLHDINGLLGVRQNAMDLKVILLNDNGGGIFSYLPISAHSGIFEPLVAMPHGRDFGEAARFYGMPHSRFSSLDEFVSAYLACLERRGPEILEVQYDRERSHDTGLEIFRQFGGMAEAGL